jgi:xanthine/uracil permease
MLTSQIAKGATDSLWLVGVQTVGVVVIFILSVIYGKGKLLRRDVVALVAAGVGVALWLVTKEALYALVISIVVDMIGALLTVVKAYERPESETMSTWFLSGAAGIFAALSIGSLDWVLLLFPLYVIAINYTVVGAMLLGKKIKAKRLHS